MYRHLCQVEYQFLTFCHINTFPVKFSSVSFLFSLPQLFDPYMVVGSLTVQAFRLFFLPQRPNLLSMRAQAVTS